MENPLNEYYTIEHGDLNQVSEADSKIKTTVKKIKTVVQDAITADLEKNGDSLFVEDSKKFLNDLYSARDVIIKESWEVSENIHGKIVHTGDHEVYVDCLIDISNKVFEHRAFPRNLFEHLNNLEEGIPVFIKTRSKIGSTRIDIYPGEGLVDLSVFDQKEGWEELEGTGLDSKLTEW